MFTKGFGFGRGNTGSGGGTIQTLSNGLTLVGTDGQLGGTLTQNTAINGGGLYGMDFTNNSLFRVQQGGSSFTLTENVFGWIGAFGSVSGTSSDLLTNTNGDYEVFANVDLSLGCNGIMNLGDGVEDIIVTGTSVNFNIQTLGDGATYQAIPTNLTPNTIPSWQNVLDATVTASNGLTKVGSDIRLGGTLTANTTINVNNNSFTLTDSGTSSVLNILSGNTTFLGSKNYTQVYGVNTDILAQGSAFSDIQLQVSNGGFVNSIQLFRNNLQIQGIHPSAFDMWDLYFQENISRLVFQNDFYLQSNTNTLDFISELDLGITSNSGSVNITGDSVLVDITTVGDGATYTTSPTNLTPNTIPSWGNVTTVIDSITGTKFTQNLLSANWVLDTGTTYYQDVTHNLGTEDVGIEIYDSTTKKTVIVQDIQRTSINNVRIFVQGNTDNLSVTIWDATYGTTPRRQVVKNPTSPYTVQNGDIVIWDCTSGNKVLNLPNVATSSNFVFDVKKIDATANTITVDPASTEQIEGGSTAVLTAQYEAISVAGDLTAWWITASN